MIKENSYGLFRPCIDLHSGKVKQVVGSTLHNTKGVKENFVASKSPNSFANYFKKLGLLGGHVVMLGEGNESAAKQILEEWPGVFSIGGGMTIVKGKKFLSYGAKQIIFTSYLFSENGKVFNNKKLNEIKKNFSPKQVVIDLSCKKTDGHFKVMTKQWSVISSLTFSTNLLHELKQYASGFLVHAIDNEGFKNGVNTSLIEMLAESEIPNIVYAGGVSSEEEIKKVLRHGKKKVAFTVGSGLQLYGGHLTIQNILNTITSEVK